MRAVFDAIRKLFRKPPRPDGSAVAGAAREPETSERMAWSIETVLEQLDHLQSFDAREVLDALREEADPFAAALRAGLAERTGTARTNAGALLLMLGDTAGQAPFLAALAGPDGDERGLAIAYLAHCIVPGDIGTDRGPAIRSSCPILADDVFAALERDLHAPWTGLSETVLGIVLADDYPQARAITQPLLADPDDAVRQQVATSYLRAGRDEGAFAVAEQALRALPAHVSHHDPAWGEFYRIKGLWYDIEQAATRGDAALRDKAAAFAMERVAHALGAPDRARRFDINDGSIEVMSAVKAIAAAMPAGADALLERLIAQEGVDDYHRGEALLAYAAAIGDSARPEILAALQDPDLRRHAADAMQPLARGRNDPQDIAALRAAIDDEDRSDVVAALARALLAAGPDGQPAIERALERAEPWAKVELGWRIAGGTDRALADLLAEAGVMDPIDDDTLADAVEGGLDIRSLIWAGGERLVSFNVKSSTGLEHFQLFQDLLKVARPAIAVRNLKEATSAHLAREPVSGMSGVEKVTDLGTVCTVSYEYDGADFGFDVRPQGRWHDVPGVMNGFDAFMQAIGRDDRCYELAGDGEWGMFVVAPASTFEPLVARLGIPIERDPENARDAAKAYQRQIQAG